MDDLDAALARARAGDPAGMEPLYDAYAPILHAYLTGQVRRREDAEDLVGQAFLEAIRDLSRFDGDAAAFRAWLFRIARNRAVDLGRRMGRRTEVPLDHVIERPGADDPAGETVARIQAAELWRAVDSLPEQQREVVVLRLRAGLSASEIAGVVGKRRGAVKALQHRALQNLSKALGVSVSEKDAVEPDDAAHSGAAPAAGPYPAEKAERSHDEAERSHDETVEPTTGGESRR